MPDPVNLATPAHRGLVLESFSIVHNRQVLDYQAGAVVTLDGFTRRAIEAIGGPIHWHDVEAVPGLVFARGLDALPVDAMRPGVIYAADAVDPTQSKQAHKFGKIARVSVEIAGAEPVHGWVRAR